MKLDLIEKLPGPDDRPPVWFPFTTNKEFSHDWWERPFSLGDRYTLFEVHHGPTEVARIQLDSRVGIEHYVDTPRLGDAALEIQFFEVAASHRCRGIGTEVVRTLEVIYPDRRFLAFSEAADGFWASLGWDRHDHPDGPRSYRPLFIQPTPI